MRQAAPGSKQRDPCVSAALDALASGKPEQAEKVCREGLERDPNSIEMLRLLGRSLAMQSRLDEAEQQFAARWRCGRISRRCTKTSAEFSSLQRRFEEAVASSGTR